MSGSRERFAVPNRRNPYAEIERVIRSPRRKKKQILYAIALLLLEVLKKRKGL